MTFDLVILGLVVLFAFIGAYTGAAKQLAQLAGMVAAYASARPLGTVLAPHASELLGGPRVVGQVAATLLCFIVVLAVVRVLLAALLKRLWAGKSSQEDQVDRPLGFALGGVKVAVLAYVVICALSFVEQHVVVAGKKIGFSPKDSLAFALARRFNLFELTQFSAVKDLAQVAKMATDPEQASKVRSDPAFQALRKDPRFQRALEDATVAKAIESGDYRALLESNAILQLIQDPAIVEKLTAAAERP
ncbi:MAG: CvpA family protein [Myxococcota bacterium]